MAAPDPNILNPFILLDPTIFQTISLLITIPSLLFSFIISWHFFRSYRFSGFGYLLGLPVGFVFLALSFLFQHLNLIFSNDPSLYLIFFWIELASQSEALALIAISYHFKSKGLDNYHIDDGINFVPSPKNNGDRGFNKTKKLVNSCVPLIMIAIPFIVPVSDLVLEPGFTYYGLADLSLFLRIFNMTVLCYIFFNSVISLVKAANINLYIPGAFALLWLEQYSLVITYFENNSIAYLESTIVRLAGLTLFVYIVYTITSRGSRRNMQIETRE